jgi:hypothetical protein
MKKDAVQTPPLDSGGAAASALASSTMHVEIEFVVPPASSPVSER